MREEQLPLFPLQVVLFPHAALPLHIFEERYRTLIRLSIRDAAEFGIVLMMKDRMSTVGCSAAVTTVLQSYDDGRMDILVEGRRRFRTVRVREEEAPYLVGDVEFFAPPAALPQRALFERTVGMYNHLVQLVYAGKVKTLDPGVPGPDLSYVMAQKAGMELEQRQRLLELETEEERLEVLQAYLTLVLPRLEKLDEIERVIRSDGYM